MLDIVFLGHQGWVLSDSNTTILIDPLLVETFGHGRSEVSVFPPREFHWDKFPNIEAVILSHEHEDHFSIPSLNALSRDVAIYVSPQTSTAMFEILTEMGFHPKFLPLGEPFKLGTLNVFAEMPDTRKVGGDEWGVCQVWVWAAEGECFFTMVDVAVDERNLPKPHPSVPVATVIAYPNNYVDWMHHSFGFPDRGDMREWVVSGFSDTLKAFGRTRTPEPSLWLFCGLGFAFSDSLAHLNAKVFPLVNTTLAEIVHSLYPTGQHETPLPGSSYRLENGKVLKQKDFALFLQPSSSDQWPERKGSTGKELGYPCYSTKAPLSEQEWVTLENHLKTFFSAFFFKTLFRDLVWLTPQKIGGKIPHACVVLLDGEDGYRDFVFDPRQASKVSPSAAENPWETYVAGFECWARDLLGVFEGTIGNFRVSAGRWRFWCHTPHMLDPEHVQWLVPLFPLYATETALKLYRHLWSIESKQGSARGLGRKSIGK